MKKMILIAGLLSISLIVLAWGGMAIAEGHGHGRAFGPGMAHGHGPFAALSAAIHARASVGQLIQDLDLSPEQMQHLGAIHDQIAGGHQERLDSRHAHLQAMLARIDEGQLESADARAVIDGRIEVLRQNLYTVADELVALVNSLDDEQRAILEAHLEKASDRIEAVRGH